MKELVMSLDHAEISCPICHSTDVSITGEPIVSHKPDNYGWYGQVHTIDIPIECKCGQAFAHKISAYKCRIITQILIGLDKQ